MKQLCKCLLMCVVVIMVGCAGSEQRPAPAPVEEISLAPMSGSIRPAPEQDQGSDVQVLAYSAPAPFQPQAGNAVVALVDAAEQHRQAADFHAAAAKLERALGLEPRNPHVWNRLARVRLEQGQFDLAADLAAKSNTLAGDIPGLQRDNWLIIARAQRNAGDNAGADAAEAEAAALR